MSTVIINGTSGIYEQPQERGQDSSGPYRVLRWEGTRASMRAKELTLGLVNYVYKESFSGAKDSIEVRLSAGPLSDGEIPQITWELRYSMVEKDILRSNAALALTKAQKKQLRTYMAGAMEEGDEPVVFIGSVMEQFVEIIKAGEVSVRQSVPTLTRSIVAANPLIAFLAVQNIGRIFKTGSLFTYEGLLPNDIVFPLPNDVDPIPNSNAPAILRYGWQKTGVTETRTAYQKTSVTQEYEYGLWPEIVYGIPL